MSFTIPAIDIINGEVVRLTEGAFDSLEVYSKDPLEVAKSFQEVGLSRLHLVDLDGARKGFPCNLDVLEKISLNCNLKIDYSGGLRDRSSIEKAFDKGASFISIGSKAVEGKSFFSSCIKYFGSDKIILSADVRDEYLAIKGWEEQTEISIFKFISEIKEICELKHIIVTDISKDGKLLGPSFSLYSKLIEQFSDLEIIASGGVHEIEDVLELKKLSLKGVIIGKAIYEGKIPLKSLS